MKLTFNTVSAAVPPQGKKPDKNIEAIQPLVDRFASGLRALAASATDANPVTLEQVILTLSTANTQAKKISELPIGIKPIVVSSLVEQANEAGFSEFTNDHVIEVLKYPKNVMPVAVEVLPLAEKPIEGKKEKPAPQRVFLNVDNRLRESVLFSYGYLFREGIDTEYLDGVPKGPDLEIGNNYAIIILSENGRTDSYVEPLRNHVEFYGKKDSNLRFKTLDDKPLKTLGRHLVFIKVDVKAPPYRPVDEKKTRVDEGDSYVPDPEVLAVMNRGRYSKVFSG